MALSYSHAFTTSNMQRITCTRDGEFRAAGFSRTGYGFTASGDTSEANRWSTVTIKVPQVTTTGWSNSGSTNYRVYCTLQTPFGTYQTPTTTLKWNKNTTTRTLTFTFESVLGEWIDFKVWANQDTYTTTSGPYMYFFNNAGGTITVTYSEGSAGTVDVTTGFLRDSNNSWRTGQFYIFKKSNPTTYSYPQTAMTSDNSANCVTSASSVYNANFPAWRAFDKAINDNCWASTAADTQRWIQIVLPKKLYNIKVEIVNPNGTNGPISGIIYGSNSGSSETQIGSFSGRTTAAKASTTVTCNNTAAGYNTVKIKTTSAGAISLNNVAIGEITISGTDIGTNGDWVEATPFIRKTNGTWG